MASTTRHVSRRGGRVGLFLAAWLVLPAVVVAEPVLFPRPLHITREVRDSLAADPSVVDEYCHGNRIVSIAGSRTAIADFGARTLTEIDFERGTWSVTSFEALASAREALAPGGARASSRDESSPWRVEHRGPRAVGPRRGDSFELRHDAGEVRRTVRITADRELTLSRPALEALLGLGHPNRRDEGGEALVEALARSGSRIAADAAGASTRELPFPLEHVMRIEMDGEVIERASVVLRVGEELPPPERLAVPPGATLVESRHVAAHRLMLELDGGAAANR